MKAGVAVSPQNSYWCRKIPSTPRGVCADPPCELETHGLAHVLAQPHRSLSSLQPTLCSAEWRLPCGPMSVITQRGSHLTRNSSVKTILTLILAVTIPNFGHRAWNCTAYWGVPTLFWLCREPLEKSSNPSAISGTMTKNVYSIFVLLPLVICKFFLIWTPYHLKPLLRREVCSPLN